MKRRRKTGHSPDAHVNVTSLLDVVFVLLISFMVAAPAMRQNVKLDLPKTSQSKPMEDQKPIRIEVSKPDATGNPVFYVDNKQVELNQVASAITGSERFSPERTVALEADRTVPWEDMAQLITELKSEGIQNVGIVTERGAKR